MKSLQRFFFWENFSQVSQVPVSQLTEKKDFFPFVDVFSIVVIVLRTRADGSPYKAPSPETWTIGK